MILSVNPFFNELDLLEIKLNTLRDVVDAFVICEATRTFTGINKPLYFDEHKGRFREFNIHHVVVNDLPLDCNPWVREGYQRDRMYAEVTKLNPEIVLWSDCDECPRPEVVSQFKSGNEVAVGLDYDSLLYYFNRCRNVPFSSPRVLSRDGRHHIRSTEEMRLIPHAGWHFNLIRSRADLLDKVNATSHCVDEGSRDFWGRIYQGHHPTVEITEPYPEDQLPTYVLKHRERFSDLFLSDDALLL